jgi:beta-glucosidase-like glycosyl hydrolase
MPADKEITESLERKLYQLIISRLDGERISDAAYRESISELARRGICGFIIFGGEKGAVRRFIEQIQAIPEIPLFIASDVERGVGQQILGTTLFPCQMALAAAVDAGNPEDVALLRRAVGAIADEAKDVGLNMLLIPVLDVNRNPDNPIICTRAFSDDPEDVAWFGSEYIDILENSGIISCAKHFPGHGDTSADSHMTLPVIDKSYKDLMETDVIPFTKAIRRGVGSIMVGHLSVPALDSRPASLSRKISTDFLRADLGFDGLVITDALNMNALKDMGKVSVECLKAGADILLHPIDPHMTVKELMYAVESGEIAMEQIEAAADRILRAKTRLKKAEKSDIDYPAHERLSFRMTDMSISLLKDAVGLLPIPDKSEVSLIFAGDGEMYKSSPLKKQFEKYLSLHGIAEKSSFPPDLAKGETGGRYDCALFAIFTSVSAWKGSSGLSEEEKNGIHNLMKKAGHSIVISFGSPYVLRHFKEADILIAAYESTEQAQMAVLKCLEGRLDFQGRIPVKINWSE